jgi:hypothetical protein
MDRYQKGLLLALAAMALIFGCVYAAVVSRTGYFYHDRILEPVAEGGATIYRAEVGNEEWRITVTADKTVTFRFGQNTYGPYTARIDPTAVPQDQDLAEHMTGVEVRERDQILFRGGIMAYGAYDPDGSREWMLFGEDGSPAGLGVFAVMGDGVMVDGSGYVVDPLKPSVSQILRLMEGPRLTHRGDWLAWFAGLLISVICALSMIFAEELFRWNLVFRVRDVDLVEPSDWEIACRYIGWTLMALMAFGVYMKGLK